ncbi:UNVERIFIED_CONTAM: hypothetical protein K2H54_030283 [Gekko kuhli]
MARQQQQKKKGTVVNRYENGGTRWGQGIHYLQQALPTATQLAGGKKNGTYYHIHKLAGMIDSALQRGGEKVLVIDEVFCLANQCTDRDVASIQCADAL